MEIKYMKYLYSFAPSMIVLGFLLCIAPALPKKKTWARTLMVVIGLAVAIRYLTWRLSDTICPTDLSGLEGAWIIIIFIFEILSFVNYVNLFFILTRVVDRSEEADDHEAKLRRTPVEQLPSVDVFIPTYNEEIDVLRRTIVAAQGIDYPRFQVWVLDDGGRDWLRDFCANVGVHYVRRREHLHAKAGNLNHGLSVSSGDLFAILDADFVPLRNFLYRTVGFFSNPKIGILQTPQHFFNRDPIQLNLGLPHCLPDEQRLFFDVIAPSRDAWNGAFCCGSCSIQRRDAIEAAGGVPTESITEDILSTMVLIRKGYITRYLNERISIGLASESLEGYFTQRQRWCRGALQTLFLRSGPLGPGLTLLQRFLFFPLDWLIQYFVRFLMLIIPIVYLWTGIRPFIISSFDDLLSYQLPVLLVLMGLTRWFAPNCYMPVVSTAVSLFTSFRIIPTVLATLIKPFGTPFRVTPKGSNVVSSFGDRTVLWTACVLAILTIGGLVINRISSDPSLGDGAYLTAAEVGALFNLVLLALVALMSIESPRPRNQERFPADRPSLCRIRGQELPCIIRNISETGALLDVPVRVDSEEAVELMIEGVGLFSAETVRIAGSKIAIRFSGNPNDKEYYNLIKYIYCYNFDNSIKSIDDLKIITNLIKGPSC